MLSGCRSRVVVRGPRSPPPPPPSRNDPVGTNFGRLDLFAFLVRPGAGLNAAFDVNLFALGQVFLQRLRGLAPDHNPVPLRVFALLTFFVGELLRGREADRRDRRAAGRESHLGVAAEVSHENCLVNTAHCLSFCA
jgi:hypothetical protein